MKTRICSIIAVIVLGLASVAQAVEWEGEWKPKVFYVDLKGNFSSAEISQTDRDGRASMASVLCHRPALDAATGEVVKPAARGLLVTALNVPVTSKVGDSFRAGVKWGDGQMSTAPDFERVGDGRLMLKLSFFGLEDWAKKLLRRGSVEYAIFDDSGEFARVRVSSDGFAKGIRALHSLCSRHALLLDLIGE